MSHPELPWKVGFVRYNDWGGKNLQIMAANDIDEVVGGNVLSEEDAAFIVKCVNGHQKLVEACKELAATSHDDFCLSIMGGVACNCGYDKVIAALEAIK